MTEIAATGTISRMMDVLRTGLSQQAAFLTWCGAGSGSAAKARIVLDAEPAAEPTRPYIVLLPRPDCGSRRQVAVATLFPTGGLRVAVFGTVPSDYVADAFNGVRSMHNSFYALLDCLGALSGTIIGTSRIEFGALLVPGDGQPGFVPRAGQPDATKPYELWEGEIDISWGTVE